MPNQFNAVVTGSSSGIGLGIAEALDAAGINLMLNGIEDFNAIESERRRLEQTYGVDVGYNGANLMEAEGIRALIVSANEMFGKVDILINNAGIQYVAPIEEFPDEKWEAILSLNLSAAFHGVKAGAAAMKERGWGRIINIASAHSLVASPNKAAYVAAKHGLLGLTKTAALEFAEYGVTVNAICPGYVWTPLVEKQIPDTAEARGITEEEVKRDVILHAQPTREFATVEQIGALARFLCTDDVASITGAALPVDGGWTAQ